MKKNQQPDKTTPTYCSLKICLYNIRGPKENPTECEDCPAIRQQEEIKK